MKFPYRRRFLQSCGHYMKRWCDDENDIMFNKAMAKMGVCPNCIEGRTKPRNGKKPMILLERDKKQ